MGFSEQIRKIMDKSKENKEEFKSMEREERFKRKLEQKNKSPAQKEHEFYQREKAKEDLDKLVKQERKQREEKMKALNNPFNKKDTFHEKLHLKDGGLFNSGRNLF